MRRIRYPPRHLLQTSFRHATVVQAAEIQRKGSDLIRYIVSLPPETNSCHGKPGTIPALRTRSGTPERHPALGAYLAGTARKHGRTLVAAGAAGPRAGRRKTRAGFGARAGHVSDSRPGRGLRGGIFRPSSRPIPPPRPRRSGRRSIGSRHCCPKPPHGASVRFGRSMRSAARPKPAGSRRSTRPKRFSSTTRAPIPRGSTTPSTSATAPRGSAGMRC